MTGAKVTPPVATVANGEIKVTLNAAVTQATVFGEFHNLSSNQTGARIETTVGTITTVRDLGVVGGRNGNFASATFTVTAAQVQQLRVPCCPAPRSAMSRNSQSGAGEAKRGTSEACLRSVPNENDLKREPKPAARSQKPAAGAVNPNGVASFSPGLRGTSYPGWAGRMFPQP